MVIVTDKEYFLEKRLVSKLDLIADRVTRPNPKKDASIIIEGGEGEGKSTLAGACGYYLAYKTNRPFSNKNFFFKLKPLIEFAQSTENQIIILDEPGLEGLSTDWYNRANKDLVRLLMLCRKKRHIFIFCFTKFYKFSDYITVERSLALIHVYSRRNIEPGRFVYIPKKRLERLVMLWRSSRKRGYKTLNSFRGSFPDVLDKLIDIKAYEAEKDKAIAAIGEVQLTDNQIARRELHILKGRLARVKFPINNFEELAQNLSTSRANFSRWLVYPTEREDKLED